jgi:septum formation protein
MTTPPPLLILASGSPVRAAMLAAAGIPHRVEVPRVDEVALRDALLAEGSHARDIADALAEAKARKVAQRYPQGLVLGADQVLDLDGAILSKADSPRDACGQLQRMSDRPHRLLSAAVLYDGGRPVWRHVSTARLTVRPLSVSFIEDYVARNWDDIRTSVGCYRIEGEGVRLMSRIEGDHFTILGLPLVELLNYLVVRGELPT